MKNNNDLNITNYQKRKKLRYAMITFSILTIVLALLSLTIKLNIFYGIASFVIVRILKYMHKNTIIYKKDEMEDFKKELDTHKKSIKDSKKVDK